VAAGVPVVASDLPELARLIARHRIGWTVDATDLAALAAALRHALGVGTASDELAAGLTSDAGELTWQRERAPLLDVYRRLAATGGAAGTPGQRRRGSARSATAVSCSASSVYGSAPAADRRRASAS